MDKVNVQPKPARSLLRRFALILFAFFVVLALVGFIYENIAESRDRRFNSKEGMLVDVNGHKMHIDCVGDGSPSVILDSGLGDTYLSWRKVQSQIANQSKVRVCSYDRAGLGYSESVPGPRTSKVIAEQLHSLLMAARIPPPYVLVGHSMGGYDVRLYASLYRDEVAGMVLVDASHPDQDNRFPAEMKNMEGTWEREAEFLEYGMPFGIPRLMGFCEEDPKLRAAECNWRTAHGGLAEMEAFHESAAQTAATGSLGNLPLVVLSHDPNKPSSELPPDLAKQANEAWEKMQEELAQLSSAGTHVIATGSAHYIQLDRPELVIDAVGSVVEQARKVPSMAAPSTAGTH